MKKPTTDQGDILLPPAEPENKPVPQKTKKRSLPSALFRGLVYSVLFIFLLMIGAGVVLEFYFPAEKLRVLAEEEGSKQLQLPLSIKKIELSLLSGVRVHEVTLGPASQPLATAHTLALDYDLFRLFQGHLVISQVLVDRPQLHAISNNGVWNFQPLLNLAAQKNISPSSRSSGPPLPFAEIDLQEFSIRNASAKLEMGDQLFAQVEGLHLQAKGKANQDAIDLDLQVLLKADKTSNITFKQQQEKLNFRTRATADLKFSTQDLNKLKVSGSFGLKENLIQLRDALPAPDLKGNLTAELQLKPELLNLSSFSLILDNENEVQLSTKVKNFSTDPEIELNIKKVSLQLADVLRWASKWIPHVSGRGILKAENLNAASRLPGFTFDDLLLKGGLLLTEDLALDYPALQIHLEKMNSALHINEITIKNGEPQKVSADLEMKLAKGNAQKTRIENWNQTLNLDAEGPNLSKIKMRFNTDVQSLHYDHPSLNQIQLPFHVEGFLEGDWKRGDVNLQKISYHFGPMAEGTISGTIKEKKSIQLQKNLTVDIAQVLGVLPKEISGKTVEGSGQAEVSLAFSGMLGPDFSPTDLNGKTRVTLTGLSTNLDKPRIQVHDLNSEIQFPLAYKPDLGIKLSQLNINARFEKLHALDNWNLNDFSMKSQLTLDSFYKLKSAFGTLPIKLSSQIKFNSLESAQPDLSISDFTTDTRIKGDLQPNDFRNSQLEGELSFKNVRFAKKLKIGEIGSRFSLQVHDKSLSRVRLSQTTKISSPSFGQDNLDLSNVTIESVTRKNLKDGNFEVDKLHLKTADLVDVSLKGNAKNWGESFGLESKVANLQLASIWENVPSDMKKGLDSISLDGRVDLSLKALGNLPPLATPRTEEDKKPAENFKPFERWAKLFSPLDPNNLPPIEVATQFRLQNGKVDLPEKNINGKELNFDTQLNFKNGIGELSGTTSGKLKGMDFFDKVLLYPEFKFRYRLENLNTYILAEHQLTLKNRGIRHTLKGKLVGLKSFITGRIPLEPAKLLQNLDIALKTENNMSIADALPKELFGNVKTKGNLNAQFKLNQSAGQNIKLDGHLGFDKFAVEIPELVELKNLTGKFPFSKTLILDSQVLTSKSADISPAQKRFFTQLRDFSRYKNNIQADSLEVAGQKISKIGMDIVFKDNRLTTDKFIFDVLGGTVGGNFSITQTQNGPTLKFVTEFAKIDASRLLPSEGNQNLDSQIDGNMEVVFHMQTQDRDDSLDPLLLEIAITRIEAKTLDRLLLFIDPEESKPAIVDTRAKLKIAAPHRVRISLENGNLNLEAWLKSDLLGIIKAPELKRIPIAGLKRFATINEQLQSLKGAMQALNFIAAKGISFENEKLVLKY